MNRYLTLTLLLGGACGVGPHVGSDTIPLPDTSEAEWEAATIGGSPLVPHTRVTMQTSPGGTGGYTGCNWYGVRRDSSRALVEMTARGCRSDIQDQERRFTMLLPQAVRAVRWGDSLRLLDSVPSELIIFVKRRPTDAQPAQLVGTYWRLASATRPSIVLDSVLLRFSADSVAGFGGCRAFDGTYTARSDGLRFTSISMRSLECTRERARIGEENLTTAFSETAHFEIRGDTLVLTTFGGDTLRFRPLRPSDTTR